MVQFTAYGVAQPAGSKTVGFTKTGRHFVRDSAKGSAEWKRTVAQNAGAVMSGRALLEGPLSLRVVFVMPRPKGHFGKTGVRSSAPPYPTVAPDATKLLRAVEDACQGIVFVNDAAVVDQHVFKRYGHPARIEVTVMELRPDGVITFPPLAHSGPPPLNFVVDGEVVGPRDYKDPTEADVA